MRCQPCTRRKARRHQMLIISAGRRIDQVHRRDVALAARRRRHAAETADRQRACGKAALRQRADHRVEREVVAAHDHQIGRMRGASPISVTSSIRTGIERGGKRVDLEKAVGLREAGDRARALADGKRERTFGALDQRHQHEFLAAELGGDAHRYARLNRLRRFRRQARRRRG